MDLKAGTRGSLLAWTQAGWALERVLGGTPGTTGTLVHIDTKGDKDQHTPLASLSGTGLFVKELEAALIEGEIDFAIHSLKDVPFDVAPGCRLFFLSREDPRDALISPFGGLSDLPHGALVGTGSPRRIAQLKAARPDLRFEDLRGNLDTRLRKLDEGRYQAIVLACAGLSRLGWAGRISERLPAGICLPAFGQGVLAVECREDRTDVAAILGRACDPGTEIVSLAERALMKALGGGCKLALAALAELDGDTLRLEGLVGDHLAGRVVRRRWTGPADRAVEEAIRMAGFLRDDAAREGIALA